MLIILTVGLVVASVLILCVKRSRESIQLFGLCLSLMLEICGVMIFIAKKGGLSQEVLQFLYFSRVIQTKILFSDRACHELFHDTGDPEEYVDTKGSLCSARYYAAPVFPASLPYGTDLSPSAVKDHPERRSCVDDSLSVDRPVPAGL